MSIKRDISGQKFNRLTAIESDYYNSKNHQTYWIFHCECGIKKSLPFGGIVSGKIKSCGCLNAEAASLRMRRHGKSKTKVHRTWCHMKERCNNPNTKNYARYGGRGIKVCDRWLNSFESFLEDMGEPPSPSHSIDRIDSDGNYEPGNCRWATQDDQNLNYSRNILITYRGITKPMKIWAEEINIPYHRLYQRIIRLKWSLERAFIA